MNRLAIVRAAERAYGSWPWRSRCLIGRNVVRHERSRCSATPAAATVLFSDRKGSFSLPVGFRGGSLPTRGARSRQGEQHVAEALAPASQMLATVALLVVLTVSLFG